MKVSEIIGCIENIAPLCAAAPWDKPGMQVASHRDAAEHLAVLLDPTPDAVRKALAAGADMILAHHPLSMQPRFPDTLDAYHAVLSLLFTHDTPLYSAHTSLDANLCGPAAWLADALNLQKRATLEVLHERPEVGLPYGFGIAGTLPEPMPYAAFTNLLASLIGKSAWSAAGPKPETVAVVAYCPGSGAPLADAAANARADVYITGDVKYHAALEARIRILDVGHFVLEEIMMQQLAVRLRQALPTLSVTFFPATDPLVFEGGCNTRPDICSGL